MRSLSCSSGAVTCIAVASVCAVATRVSGRYLIAWRVFTASSTIDWVIAPKPAFPSLSRARRRFRTGRASPSCFGIRDARVSDIKSFSVSVGGTTRSTLATRQIAFRWIREVSVGPKHGSKAPLARSVMPVRYVQSKTLGTRADSCASNC